MIHPAPVVLEGHGVRLEPLAASHEEGLAAAAADGRLWELFYTFVPPREKTGAYIAEALAGQRAGQPARRRVAGREEAPRPAPGAQGPSMTGGR